MFLFSLFMLLSGIFIVLKVLSNGENTDNYWKAFLVSIGGASITLVVELFNWL